MLIRDAVDGTDLDQVLMVREVERAPSATAASTCG
jgi:hypothetical protein